MKSAIFTRRSQTAAEDPDRTDEYVRFYTFMFFNSVLKKQSIKWWKLNSHKSVRIATNWKKKQNKTTTKQQQNKMICSSQLVPPARAVRADFIWQIHLEIKSFISLFYLLSEISER